MNRQVSVTLRLDVGAEGGDALIVLAIAVATRPAQESLTVTGTDGAVPVREVAAPHGGRLHVLDAAPGPLTIAYAATVEGTLPVPDAGEIDRLVALRPSRYCPSDRLGGIAHTEFGELDGVERLVAVRNWVNGRLAYVGGASRGTDDAVDTLLLGEGVCRDYAHLVIALLRSLDVPARLAAVYAPGLWPMDFHAVAEAWVDGAWHLVDATGLAPRASMLRIATGADAADTAFMSTHRGTVDLTGIDVLAIVDTLPGEDAAEIVHLT